MMSYYMAKFILQIWKYLKNAHLFTCILLISMFLSAHAKWILLWIITLSQNIGETCQVCNKKVQSFSHNKQCSNCLVEYHTKCINLNKMKLWLNCVLSILFSDYFSLQPFWWWWWFLFRSDRRNARLPFSIARNQQQNFHPIWNQWQCWHPFFWYRPWLPILCESTS